MENYIQMVFDLSNWNHIEKEGIEVGKRLLEMELSIISKTDYYFFSKCVFLVSNCNGPYWEYILLA